MCWVEACSLIGALVLVFLVSTRRLVRREKRRECSRTECGAEAVAPEMTENEAPLVVATTYSTSTIQAMAKGYITRIMIASPSGVASSTY